MDLVPGAAGADADAAGAAAAAPAPGGGGLAAAEAAAAGAAAPADLSIPPCPLHAPRPPCTAVVPSLHATGPAPLPCAVETAGATIIATPNSAPHIRALSFATFMCCSPSRRPPVSAAGRIPQSPLRRYRCGLRAVRRTGRE